jgi:hypothetical protein
MPGVRLNSAWRKSRSIYVSRVITTPAASSAYEFVDEILATGFDPQLE